MPVFTDSQQSLDNDFSAIKAKKDNDYLNNQSVWNSWWTRAAQRVRLEAGDPTIANTWGNNPGNVGGSNYYVNRARPIGMTISGYQRQNRHASLIVPVGAGDQLTADQWTKVIMGIFKEQGTLEMISEAFHEGPIISGMNVIEAYIDWSRDPLNGEIKYRNICYNEIMVDPYFKDPTGQDASFIMTRDMLPKPTVAHMMPPRYYDDIMRLSADQSGSTQDGRFQYQAAARGYSMAPKLAYDNYWYRDYRTSRKFYDIETGDRIEIREDLTDEEIEVELLLHPEYEYSKKLIPTVRLCVEVQNKVFYDGPNPYGIDRYPFAFFIGYYNKTLPSMYDRIQSVMSSLISPQLLFNRRLILNADFMESVINTGYMFRQSAVLDPKHLLQTGQGRLVPLRDHAIPLQDVVPMPVPNIPPSFFQQLQLYDDNLFDVLGMSQENLGKPTDDTSSGYKVAMRTNAGWIGQQPLFDRLDAAQNCLADITREIAQKNFTPFKISKYLEGQKPTDQFYNDDFNHYRSVTELGFNTETQRQQEFIQALELKKMGVLIPDKFLIQKATLQGKEDLIKDMEQQAQAAQQMQQMQMQLQMEEIKSRAQMAQAKALADQGLYEERHSRVAENRALALERLHEANKDDAQAALNMIKAIKELQSIDLSHLRELIEMTNALKSAQSIEANAEAKAATPNINTQQAENGSRP